MSQTNVLGRLHDADACTARPLLGVSPKYASGSIALASLVGATLYGTPAVAQVQARTQSVESYAGELFGDDLADTPVSGRTPRLNDNAIFGGRYTYNFNAMWGLQWSGGYSPNRAARVMSGKDNLGLTTADLDAVWNVIPEYAIVPYVLVVGPSWILRSPERSIDQSPACRSHGEQRLHGQCWSGRQVLCDGQHLYQRRGSPSIP